MFNINLKDYYKNRLFLFYCSSKKSCEYWNYWIKKIFKYWL